MEIRATDAPPEGVTKILVTASQIEVHQGGSSDETGWQILVPGPVEFDLVAITGVEEVLGSGILDPGRYDQVRLRIDKVEVTLQDGVTVTARVPSGRIKIVGGFTLEAGKTTILTLDFDADKSVVIAGTRNVLVKPVIKLLVRDRAENLATAEQVGQTDQTTPTPVATATPAPTSVPTATPTPIPTPVALPQPAESSPVTAASLQPPEGQPLYTTPDLNKIAFSEVDSDHMVTVTGAPGAVPGTYTVFLQSLHTGQSIKTTSSSDGSFQAQVLAPDGSTVVISYGDERADRWQQGSPALEITTNPITPLSPTEVPFTTSAPDQFGTGYWVAEGVQNGWRFQPGQTIEYVIDFIYVSPNIDETLDVDAMIPLVQPELTLVRISDAEGKPIQASFVPVFTAPTGLPIFSRGGYERPRRFFETVIQSTTLIGDKVTASFMFSYKIPEWLPSGYYVGKPIWNPSSLWARGRSEVPPTGDEEGLLLRTAASQTLFPAFRIGDAAEPRVPWMLLANTLSNGNRGAVAREDEGTFELATKVTFNADKFIIPKDDADTGQPLTYRLEPFLPTFGYIMGGPDRPAPPLVSFVFPSGELHVTVTSPDGTTEDLGRAPFRSARTKEALNRERLFGPTSLAALYELTTFDSVFDYQFDQYGRYVVTMDGWIQDANGISYHGEGTYDVHVAEVLDLDLGTFLNTPFEVGDVMAPVVHVRPGVPADIEIDFKLFPNSSAEDVISKTITGQANSFGYFHPGTEAQQLAVTAPGEYVVDVTASYTDSSGVLWMGAMKGASVVETPGTTLVAHGKRGIRLPGQELENAPPWFFARNIDPPGETGEGPGASIQLLYPYHYHTGDIAWASDAGVAIAPIITAHDPDKLTNLRLDPRNHGKESTGELEVVFPVIRPSQDLQGLQGELSAVQYPELASELAYFYTGVQRPGVTVRSFIGK